MNILFLMLSYPDVRDRNTSLYTDLVAEFAAQGHNVYVAAPLLSSTANSLHQEGNALVLRIKTDQLFNVNPIKKGIANLRLPTQFKKAIKANLKGIHFNIVITPTPPITFGSVAQWVKKKYKAKYYLILRDIFPQNAKDLGLINNKLLFNLFRNKEKKLYKAADQVGCMSQGNIDYIIKHNPQLNTAKLHLLPNWETPKTYTAPTGNMKKKYGLEGKYVAIFGGNIGLPQQLEFLLELAKQKLSQQNIIFLVLGNGTERKRVEQQANSMRLTNVIFEDTIPREDYNELVKECEVGLICLNARFTIPNIPSKTLSYFNAKIPILASIDSNTDYGQLLEDANAGFWSITGDINTYEENFDKLYESQSLRKAMGINGYDYLQQYLTSSLAYQTIINKLTGNFDYFF